uniref:hypothetical protein n=1 Tax=Teichococcus oryzae TaxID=1608942 RepID=UPI001F4F3E8E|nr:hypothetical protein [Pseudoroseomonas oryzae]
MPTGGAVGFRLESPFDGNAGLGEVEGVERVGEACHQEQGIALNNRRFRHPSRMARPEGGSKFDPADIARVQFQAGCRGCFLCGGFKGLILGYGHEQSHAKGDKQNLS